MLLTHTYVDVVQIIILPICTGRFLFRMGRVSAVSVRVYARRAAESERTRTIVRLCAGNCVYRAI